MGNGSRLALQQAKAIFGSGPVVWGEPMYQISGLASALKPGYITFGSDGITLSPDKITLYFPAIGGRFLYSDPKNLGQERMSNGLETDSTGVKYNRKVEQNGISMYKPAKTCSTMFVRDPRISWVDMMSVATDGYLYFTADRLDILNATYPGQELLLKHGRIFGC